MFINTKTNVKSDHPAKKLKLTPKPSAFTQSRKYVGLKPLNSIPFSMNAFIESLTPEQKKLLKLECQVLGKSWFKLLKDEIKKPYFIALKKFLWEEGVRGADDSPRSLKVYPPPRDIYTWSHTPLGKVRVVILGQDPYHGAGQAHGLCFSVRPGVRPPPSLGNIYKELKQEYPDFKVPTHGNLTAWAEAGVLLLNSSMTVRAGSAGSHSKKHGWEQFTDKVVDIVDNGAGRGVVFMAWGGHAASRVAKLDSERHLILRSGHPSPLSSGLFFGNKHFRQANEWLEKRYGRAGPVDWCYL
ncbi:uracil-DNA glycosylase, partial [Fistulina hepatica ATCC 64428]